MITTKKQMFALIGAFILTIVLGTVTYAFFNYTRTGTANTIKTGRIAFNTNQTDTINLTNVFPITRTAAGTDTTNTDEVVITIAGDTTYTDGVEYLVTATDVNNTIGSGANEKSVPISIIVTASNLGTDDEEYFDHRGSSAQSHLYRVLASDVVEENGRLAVGYIKNSATGINGTLTIKAYLDSSKIAISDTYPEEDTDDNDDGYLDGTTSTWVGDRTVLTTTEWNQLQSNGISFKVKVEANEGVWVEEIRTINAMGGNGDNEYYFPSDIYGQRTNIKEIYFNKMGATRMQNAYDAATIKADLTYNNEGKVLAWLEENPDDNTKYNLIIASDGDTYLPETSFGIFGTYYNVVKIEFNNVNTSRVTNMMSMFLGCENLTTLDLSSFDTSNVISMATMFYGCSRLTSINLNSFDTSNVELMYLMFKDCISLEILDLSSFDTSSLSFNNSGAYYMFSNCPSLDAIYVSNKWNLSNQPNNMTIFDNNTSLVGTSPNGTTYAFTDYYNSNNYNTTDKTYARIATDDTVGYLTDVSLKPNN